jgi:tetratricopeptide (TPR) repeat protein
MINTVFFILLTICILTESNAQTTAKEFISAAALKQGMQDLNGAISDYTHALELDSTRIDILIGRGTCYMNVGKQQEARSDFLKYLEKDPMNLDLYYSIAITYLYENNHAGALPHLDKAIALNQDYPPNRTMRGQILSYLGYTVTACNDFLHAMNMGDKEGTDLYHKHCGNSWDSTEGYVLTWPAEEGWKMQSSTEDSTFRLIEFLKENESPGAWTEYGAMLTLRGFEAGTTLKDFSASIKSEFAARAPKVTMRIISQQEKGPNPWMIIALEAPMTTNHKNPESQLWHLVMGKSTIYGNFRAIKEKKLTKKHISEWTTFFKTGKIIEK